MIKKEKNVKKYIYYTGILFCIIVCILMLTRIVKKDKEFSANENRNLQAKPELSLDAVISGRYEEKYEDYVNDQFPFRDAWIQMKSMTDVLIGKTEENGVYKGKQNYLLEDFAGFAQDWMATTGREILDFSNRHQDLRQYVLLVPNSVYVLSDYLPANAPVLDQNAAMDTFYQEMQGSPLNLVDIRSSFLNAANREELYYKTDHHWTTQGAYLAFQNLAGYMGLDPNLISYTPMKVTSQFQGTLVSESGLNQNIADDIIIYMPEEKTVKSVVSYVEEQQKTATFYQRENLNKKDAYSVFLNGNHSLIKIKTPTQENRRLLILKDSYANCFIPFLAPYYREIVVVDPRYYFGNLEELMQTESISEILFLYNTNTFFQDTSLKNVVKVSVE